MNYYSRTQLHKGFTLIESLIAILIFSLSIIALMTVLAKGMQSSRSAYTQMIAGYLAQEGVEAVRNIRDTYAVSGLGLISFENDMIARGCLDPDGCSLNSNSILNGNPVFDADTLDACGGQSCGQIVLSGINPNSSLTYSFIRKIIMEKQGNDYQVTTIVNWQEGRRNRQVELVTYLTTWPF